MRIVFLVPNEFLGTHKHNFNYKINELSNKSVQYIKRCHWKKIAKGNNESWPQCANRC